MAQVEALLLGLAIICADAVEVLGKHTIARPDIYVTHDGAATPVGLGHSFPSGHAARSVILAATASVVWPRLWPVFAGWAAAVLVTAEIGGIHTLSDLTGGLVLGATLILAVLALCAANTTGPTSRLARPATVSLSARDDALEELRGFERG